MEYVEPLTITGAGAECLLWMLAGFIVWVPIAIFGYVAR